MKGTCTEIEEILIDANFKTSQEALSVMAGILVNRGVCKPSFVDAILKREREFPTGLETESGIGVALPHTDVEHVICNRIIVSVLKDEVDFGVMGFAQGKVAVKIIVMMAISDVDSHIPVLQKISDLLMDADRLMQLTITKDQELIRKIFEDLLYRT